MEGDVSAPRRYERGSPEFTRVANLSDAVFAIAMTLLVLTLDRPEVPAGRLARALLDGLPQLVAFALAFALVANIWWAHHKFLSTLGSLEPGLIALTLVLLGAVARVPFPTNLIGHAPTERAAVLPFIAVFVAPRAVPADGAAGGARGRVAAADAPGRVPLARRILGREHRGNGARSPRGGVGTVAGLVVAALNGTAAGIVMGALAPSAYRGWA